MHYYFGQHIEDFLEENFFDNFFFASISFGLFLVFGQFEFDQCCRKFFFFSFKFLFCVSSIIYTIL